MKNHNIIIYNRRRQAALDPPWIRLYIFSPTAFSYLLLDQSVLKWRDGVHPSAQKLQSWRDDSIRLEGVDGLAERAALRRWEGQGGGGGGRVVHHDAREGVQQEYRAAGGYKRRTRQRVPWERLRAEKAPSLW